MAAGARSLLALAAELAELPWPPTVIIDSGNGIAPLWQLEAVLPNVEEHQGAIEALGRRIEKALGGIENTSNIDRLLRLPGPINLPDAKKLGKGRGPTLSYETAVAKGDLRFGDFLEMHHAAVRAELARYRGEEVNTAGDGFVAAFDGPARAIRCALAIRSALDAAGIACRIGLHTGECGVRHGDLVGIALHIATRVAESAPPGAVLVSQTVKDLVAGSGLNFKDAGVHRLKGLPDEWHLYDVVSR